MQQPISNTHSLITQPSSGQYFKTYTNNQKSESNNPLFQDDTLELSEAAQKIIEETKLTADKTEDARSTNKTDDAKDTKSTEDTEDTKQKEAENKKIDMLEKRNIEVQQHEQAHKSIGGSYAGPIVYEYTTGPNGKRYAINGHVNFDVSKESTPEATLRKAEIIYRAALAPSDPSTQDMSLAKAAQDLKQEAQQQKQSKKNVDVNIESDETPETHTANSETIDINSGLNIIGQSLYA